MTEAGFVLEACNVTHRYGTVQALTDVTLRIRPGSVHCLLGDNGAGKSTLIQVISGVVRPSEGEIRIDGIECRLTSPHDAIDRGIATLFQDLAVVPIMPVYRNFFLGREPVRGWGPLRRFDRRHAKMTTREALESMGVENVDVNRPIMTLSGGQRQSVAIARAVYFGARLLILDEPTSALGVRQAEITLRLVAEARDRGLGVILITHNVHHALPIGDEFTVLTRGGARGPYGPSELSVAELEALMAGGRIDVDQLRHAQGRDRSSIASET